MQSCGIKNNAAGGAGALGWMFFIASRYVFKKGNRVSKASVLAMLEIAAGVLALTVIIAVMNGFQLGFIENILEVSSYYVRIENLPREKLYIQDELKKLPDFAAVVPFTENEGILRGVFPGSEAAIVLRGLPAGVFNLDKNFAAHLEITDGGADKDSLLKDGGAIILGSELAARLGMETGDEIQFVSINELFSTNEDSETLNLTVSGIFKTGYYEYDLSWAFTNLDAALSAGSPEGGAGQALTLGIKLGNRYGDLTAIKAVNTLLEKELGAEYIREHNIAVHSWRDYNKSFFGALRTEKLMMFVLVGLIFIVVALNIFQSQRRMILEKSREIGLLHAIGVQPVQLRFVFSFNGLIIGFFGAGIGTILAVLTATHIKAFFASVEFAVNIAMYLIHFVIPWVWGGGNFSVFDRKIFYLEDIPSRLIAREVVLIYLFGFLSAFAAAWFSSRRSSKINPALVLRYE